MNPQQIFGLQVLLSFLVYGLVARWYVTPRLASLPLHAALQPLLVLHASRHLGMVFLVPTVVGPALPASFAVPAAYGDLLAGLLALAAIGALRARSRIALPQGLANDVQLGAAYFIPTFVVPALVVTHVMIFRMLVRHPR
jgi:hypothetical protein